MALVPLMYDEVFDSEPSWGELYDQHFGLGLSGALYPEGRPLSIALRSGYLRPWRQLPALKTGVSQIKLDKEGFKVNKIPIISVFVNIYISRIILLSDAI
jgi:hypothetical protein